MIRRKYSKILLLLLTLSAAFIVSCSVEKNTAATRSFHNLTSRYNIYFNASESYKEGINRASESFSDDFTDILPLFYYEDESVHQSVGSQMKRVIDKCTKLITFHSITAKPKVKEGNQTEKDKAFYDKNEYNKWVDDAYLLIGKAYMHQGEFFMAAESFKHVMRTFPLEEPYYLAMAWLMRANMAIDEMDDAEELLVALQDVEEFPKKHQALLYTTIANYYLHLEEYADAADYLEKALDTRLKKPLRIRYSFILAQVYSKAGNSEASIDNFKKVVRMNPPYVLAFNAKVSMAEAFQAGSSDSDEIKKLLRKLLKDPKNLEYQDQIYFALGNIAMEEGERDKAIDYYHQSVAASVQNNHQKGESCLTLAEIYYNEPEYTLSAAYYDTAVNLLESDYPGYQTLQTRSRSLNNLVYNINMYELQDSIQRLATLTESERNAIVDDIIAEVRREEQEAKLRQQQAMQDLQFARSGFYENQSGLSNNQSGGKWYFYNLNAKSFGQPEFRMKWGERKLEDNWRRSNKQTMTSLMDENGANGTAEGDTAAAKVIDNKSREYYLRDIPLSDSAMEVSNDKLEEALYNAGMIYKDDLLDYQKAIESLERLVYRYPDGDFTMASLYYLYDLYNGIQKPDRAESYKQQLSRKYPDSHMAKLLTNPNYIKELEAEQRKSELYYQEVYDDYTNGRYEAVLNKSERGFAEYSDDVDMLARLSYLRALSTGALSGKEAMKTELDSILAHYPGTEVASEAKEIIDYMYVTFPVIQEAVQVQEAVELYTYDPEAEHLFLLAVKKSVDLNRINFNLINYNLDNFNAYDLVIEMKQLGKDYNLLHVSGFSSRLGVERYAERIRNDIVQIMGEIPQEDYAVVLISNENYAKLLEVKEFKPYLLFYRQNYTP